ncbi:MAG: phosphate signaling complex protein PhoU [Erysipelotrichales bacterium]
MIMLDEMLASLDKDLKMMFDKTIKAHNHAVESLLQADNKKAEDVIEKDDEINKLEETINYDVMITIAKYQPVATDLRKLISIIKISSNLERIADYAKTISRTAIVNNDETFLSEMFLKNTLTITNITTQMLEDALVAFEELDAKKAQKIIDDEHEIANLVKETIRNNPFELIKEDNVDSYVLLMSVIRTLERSRGHIANICEAIIFADNGAFLELNKYA